MLGYFYYFCDGIPAFLSYLFIFYNYPIFVTVKRCKQPWDEIDRKVWPLSESFRPKRIEFLSLQWIFNGVTVKRKILMSTFYWCCLCFCWSEFIILQFSFNRGRQTAVKDYGCTKEVCFSIGSVLAGMVHYSTKWILDCKMPRFRGQFALEILIFDRLCPSYSGIKNLTF